MRRKSLTWTLFGCVVVYVLLTIQDMFGDGGLRPIRVVLYFAIIAIAAGLVLAWLIPRLLKRPPKSN
jgi:hypothetical protein